MPPADLPPGFLSDYIENQNGNLSLQDLMICIIIMPKQEKINRQMKKRPKKYFRAAQKRRKAIQ